MFVGLYWERYGWVARGRMCRVWRMSIDCLVTGRSSSPSRSRPSSGAEAGGPDRADPARRQRFLPAILPGYAAIGILAPIILSNAAPIDGHVVDRRPRNCSYRGTAPVIDQILVTSLDLDAAPGGYVSLIACLALVALWRWPETAFKPTI